MKCEKCGAEFEGNFCNNCGAKSSEIIEQTPEKQEINPEKSAEYYEALKKIESEKDAKKKKKRKNKRIGCLSIFLIFALLIAGYIIKNDITKQKQITDALKAKAGYTLAYENYTKNDNEDTIAKKSYKFAKLSFKNDVSVFGVKLCNKALEINKEKYEPKIKKLLEKYINEYKDAEKYENVIDCIELYKSLGGKIENKDLIQWTESCGKEQKYEQYSLLMSYLIDNEIEFDKSLYDYYISIAETFVKNGNYESALEAYEKYNGDKNYEEKLIECKYKLGVQEFKNGDLSEARENIADILYDYDNYYNYKSAREIYIWIVIQQGERDGSIEFAEAKLKNRLKDPSSYIRSDVSLNTNHFVKTENSKVKIEIINTVKIYYSATNSFNARISDVFSDVQPTEIDTFGLSEKETEKILDMSKDELIDYLKL